jgi:hypothetical protein
MTSGPDLDSFARSYQLGGRTLTAAERSLLKEALTDFLCHEQWMEGAADAAEAIGVLEALPDSVGPAALAAARSARATITDLAARLARREHANLIMREHLAMMSETIRCQREQLAQVPAAQAPS